MQKTKYNIKSDIVFFLGIVCCLLISGLIFVYSASSVYALERFGSAHYYARQQCLGIILGLIALLIGRLFPQKYLERYAYLFFISTLLLTSLTMLPPFCVSVHGSYRWMKIFGITFQPSELLKISFVLFVARFLSKKQFAMQSIWQSYIPFLCIICITSGLLLLQPDFGLAVTLSCTACIMAYSAQFPLKRMAFTVLASIPIAIGLILAKPYRFKRILTFMNPWADPQGAGFQIIQSLIAIGTGNIWGSGIAHSKQKFFYLPMQHTDFIFSIIAEETGFFGSFVLLTLYTSLLYFGLRCATHTITLFARYSIIGFVSLINLQALINIAVTSGLVPTKGIGLPLVSYGNSALICTLCMIGIIVQMVKK